MAYVLDGEGLARRRPITTGAHSLAAVEIVDGLDEGDQVIISSTESFRSAESVLIIN